MTTIQMVAKIVSLNPSLKNWKIEKINPQHQMSGLRMLRFLKQHYQAKKNKQPYKFDYQTNTYHFTKDFQLFCKRFCKENEKKNKKN